MNSVNIFDWVAEWLAPPELEPPSDQTAETDRAFKASLSHMTQTNEKHDKADCLRKRLNSIDREMIAALGGK